MKPIATMTAGLVLMAVGTAVGLLGPTFTTFEVGVRVALGALGAVIVWIGTTIAKSGFDDRKASKRPEPTPSAPQPAPSAFTAETGGLIDATGATIPNGLHGFAKATTGAQIILRDTKIVWVPETPTEADKPQD